MEWLAWHPRGDVLLAGSEDFTAWMWNASLGTCMQACCCPLTALTCRLWRVATTLMTMADKFVVQSRISPACRFEACPQVPRSGVYLMPPLWSHVSKCFIFLSSAHDAMCMSFFDILVRSVQ